SVGADDPQRREILEHGRIEQRHDGNALFVDEVQRVREALGAAAGRMDVAGNVELDQLFVQRIPETIAERRDVGARGFARIRIEKAADEPLFLDELFEVRQEFLRTDAGGL